MIKAGIITSVLLFEWSDCPSSHGDTQQCGSEVVRAGPGSWDRK